MIKCINGHDQPDSALHLKCSSCGGIVLFEDASAQLQKLPKVDPVFEKVSMVFVGLASLPPLVQNKDIYVSSILVGDTESEKVEAITLGRTQAKSWFEFYSRYLGKLEHWMKFVGMDRSPYRLMVVDTRRAASVLALASIEPSWRNTIVLAITGDQTSTLIEQNTSYVAITTALKKGFPVIAVSTSYVEELVFYVEKEGLVIRSQALFPIIYRLVSAVDSVMDMLGNDVRLGIKEHCLAAILSASEKVYPTVESALVAQEASFSINADKTDVATASLLAFAPADVLNRINKAFANYRRQELKSAVGADHQGYPREDGSTAALYDLLMIYGIKQGLTYQSLKTGYDSIARMAPELSMERVA